jgi:hypothetical protein
MTTHSDGERCASLIRLELVGRAHKLQMTSSWRTIIEMVWLR